MPRIDKITRTLMLYRLLERGETVNKAAFALENGINERSAERDIQDIRLFLSEVYSAHEVIYDKEQEGYRLSGGIKKELSGAEVFIILKSLTASQVLRHDEYDRLADTVLSLISPQEQRGIINQMLSPQTKTFAKNNKASLKIIWDLHRVIESRQKVTVNYTGNSTTAPITLYPYSIEVSGGSCYLVAMQVNQDGRTGATVCVDDIESFVPLTETFALSQAEKATLDKLAFAVHANHRD